MNKFTITGLLKTLLVIIGIYELSLVTNFLLAAVFTPIMFLMGSDANPEGVNLTSVFLGLGLMIVFWVCTPHSFFANWYMVFSKKTEHSKWLLWLIPLPFIGLLVFSLTGLGIRPFIPFSFN
ncbi:MAG: hypothetical protein HY457_03420 [Parcubacteria group bacterium]|nr:hypothetical protein [Parcubacteria group bacterium]